MLLLCVTFGHGHMSECRHVHSCLGRGVEVSRHLRCWSASPLWISRPHLERVKLKNQLTCVKALLHVCMLHSPACSGVPLNISCMAHDSGSNSNLILQVILLVPSTLTPEISLVFASNLSWIPGAWLHEECLCPHSDGETSWRPEISIFLILERQGVAYMHPGGSV